MATLSTAPQKTIASLHKMFLDIDNHLHTLLSHLHSHNTEFNPHTAIDLWDRFGRVHRRYDMPIASQMVSLLPDTPLPQDLTNTSQVQPDPKAN